MAWTVTLAGKRNVATTDPSTLTSGVAFAVGDIVHLTIGWSSAGTESPTAVTDNLVASANVYAEKASCNVRDATNGQSITVFACKVLTAGTPTWTVAWIGARDNCHIVAVKLEGSSATLPVDQGSAAAQAGVTTATPGSITPSNDGQIVISSTQDVNNGAVTITPSGTTINNTGATDGCATQYTIQTTATAINPSFGLSASRDTVTTVVSYKIDDGAGGGGAVKGGRLTLMGVS